MLSLRLSARGKVIGFYAIVMSTRNGRFDTADLTSATSTCHDYVLEQLDLLKDLGANSLQAVMLSVAGIQLT